MAEINILMLGGRRCGKTTILGKVENEMNKVLRHGPEEGSDLFTINRSGTEVDNVSTAMKVIEQMFTNGKSPFGEYTIDENQTGDMSITTFDLLPQQNGVEKLTLNFTDIPGEWCRTELDKLKGLVLSSQVIIIAIDTPSIMAEDAFYSDYCNCIQNIRVALEAIFNTTNMGENDHRMILFVPLKCERWVIANDGAVNYDGMVKVTNKVKEIYYEFIGKDIEVERNGMKIKDCGVLRKLPLCNQLTVAILPIVTISEVEWKKFVIVQNDKEEPIRDASNALKEPPKVDGKSSEYKQHNGLRSYYKYKPNLFNQARLRPIGKRSKSMFCDQPVIYTLVFAMRFTKMLRSKPKTFWDKVFGPFVAVAEKLKALFGKNGDLDKEISRLQTGFMIRNNGFEIIQNPLNI